MMKHSRRRHALCTEKNGARARARCRVVEDEVATRVRRPRQLFALCRCAQSNAPVTCYTRAKRSTFLLDPQIIELCGAIVTDNLWHNCTPISR